MENRVRVGGLLKLCALAILMTTASSLWAADDHLPALGDDYSHCKTDVKN